MLIWGFGVIKFEDFLVLSSIAMIHQKVMKVAIQAQAL